MFDLLPSICKTLSSVPTTAKICKNDDNLYISRVLCGDLIRICSVECLNQVRHIGMNEE